MYIPDLNFLCSSVNATFNNKNINYYVKSIRLGTRNRSIKNGDVIDYKNVFFTNFPKIRFFQAVHQNCEDQCFLMTYARSCDVPSTLRGPSRHREAWARGCRTLRFLENLWFGLPSSANQGGGSNRGPPQDNPVVWGVPKEQNTSTEIVPPPLERRYRKTRHALGSVLGPVPVS